MPMKTSEDEIFEMIGAMQEQIADLKNQCDTAHRKLGWPSWTSEKRQRADNQKAQGTRAPFHPSQHFGEKTNDKPLAN